MGNICENIAKIHHFWVKTVVMVDFGVLYGGFLLLPVGNTDDQCLSHSTPPLQPSRTTLLLHQRHYYYATTNLYICPHCIHYYAPTILNTNSIDLQNIHFKNSDKIIIII